MIQLIINQTKKKRTYYSNKELICMFKAKTFF
jgi:hypothetical protein